MSTDPPPTLSIHHTYVQVLRGLHRTQNLAARTERALLHSQSVVVTEETLCGQCSTPIGNHVFGRWVRSR